MAAERESKSKARSRSLTASAPLLRTLYSMARCRSKSADSPSILMRAVNSSISCSGPSCAMALTLMPIQPPMASAAIIPLKRRIMVVVLVFQDQRRFYLQVDALRRGMGFDGKKIQTVFQAAGEVLELNVNDSGILARLDFLGVAAAAATNAQARDFAAIDVSHK